MGTPQNEEPGGFWTADMDEAAGRLVRIVRELRPQVIVGYNAYGGYGHPDHIRASQVAVMAFERAGDPAWYPEQLAEGLEPWQPLKRYETVMDLSRRREMAAAPPGAGHPELADAGPGRDPRRTASSAKRSSLAWRTPPARRRHRST